MLWLVRHELRFGLRAVWNRHRFAARLRAWQVPPHYPSETEVTLCLLVGPFQVGMAEWMLATWTHTTGREWPILVREEPALNDQERNRLRRFSSRIEFVTPEQALTRVVPLLADRPMIRAFRQHHWIASQIIDFPLLCQSRRWLQIDSDVLFFRRPQALLDWSDERSEQPLFIQDAGESFDVTFSECDRHFQCRPYERVNLGLAALPRSIYQPDRFEAWLRTPPLLGAVTFLKPQNLAAIAAAALTHGSRGGVLPAGYQMADSNPPDGNSVARHYVGRVRSLFFTQGIPQAARTVANLPS